MARINQEMVGRLNEQIGRELAASQQYLAMALYPQHRSLECLGSFFHRQADEERQHALKIAHYLLEVGARPLVPALSEPRNEFESLTDVVRTSLEQERAVSDVIHELVELAEQQHDHATRQMLAWFVEEQVEEEASFAKLLDVIEMSQNVLQVEHHVRHLLGAAE